jgi:hypothetical protein
MTQNHNSRRLFALGVVLVAAAITAIASHSSEGAPTPPGLAEISNAGDPNVALAAPERAELQHGAIDPMTVRLLGARAGVSLFVAKRRDGGPCYISSMSHGKASSEFGAIACFSSSSVFPSADAPILDVSPLRLAPGATSPEVETLVGFAADDVAAIKLIGADGSTVTVPVVQNVYVKRLTAPIHVTAISAVSDAGGEVFHEVLTGVRIG